MVETHHRVKNNLQVIAALIELQRMDHAEWVPVDALQGLGAHVQALAIVHQLLTAEAKEDAVAHFISVESILSQILSTLEQSISGRRILTNLQDIRLSVNRATSLALVTNEVVSNAIKYGLGDISVHLAIQEGSARLEVCDHGPGFPADFDAQQAGNTGLELIENITTWDLQGQLQFENGLDGGAQVVISFPIQTEQG